MPTIPARRAIHTGMRCFPYKDYSPERQRAAPIPGWEPTLAETLMDNTLFVVISDHGHLLGEHGYTGKLGYALYPELSDTVFMIRHPEGKWAGQTSDFYASTHDVAPTVLGVLGIKPSKPMQGQDLSAVQDGEDVQPRGHFTSGYGNYVRTCDSQYVMLARDDKDSPKLFDLRNDPQETRDVASNFPEVVDRMYQDYVLKDAGGSLPVYGVES